MTFVKTEPPRKVLATPDVAELFGRIGGWVRRLFPADALIRADVERWTKPIRDAGISAGQ